MSRFGAIAVALHDVEPATFDRCALIRDWLTDHGVERVTLLVIPAPDLHSFADRRPDMVTWLDELVARGDAVAQHGFQHRRTRSVSTGRPRLGVQRSASAEFVGLPAQDTRFAVDAGRNLMRRVGLEPQGFVAPAYAYTPALRELLAESFSWWAGVGGLYRGGVEGRPRQLAPVLSLGTSTAPRRILSPLLVRAGARCSGSLLRLDLHPADLDHPRHMGAVETVLRRARGRVSLTYDELADAAWKRR